MNRMKKILAPTDFSEHSRAGVGYALKLARELGAEVTVYYAVSPEELMRYSKEMQEKLAHTVPLSPGDEPLKKYEVAMERFLSDYFSDIIPGLTIRRKVEFGEPYKNIVGEAEKEGVDWIVICTHGRTGLLHMVMGSVTEKVVRHAPCPVLSIHPSQAGKTESVVERIGERVERP